MPVKTMKKKPVAKKVKRGIPLPDSAGSAVIDGREFIFVPADDLTEWCEDMILGAIASDRLATERESTIPMEEVFARLDGKLRKK